MTFDPRCCGSGTCIVDADGRCWCGQQWDGEKMCSSARTGAPTSAPTTALDRNAHMPSNEDAERAQGESANRHAG